MTTRPKANHESPVEKSVIAKIVAQPHQANGWIAERLLESVVITFIIPALEIVSIVGYLINDRGVLISPLHSLAG